MQRLERLELRNFRCFGQDGMAFGTKTIVHGNNGWGKSSVQDALAYLATGACRGTTRDGKGIDRVRRAGEHGMSVSATFRGLGTFGRGLNARRVARGDRAGQWTEVAFEDRATELLAELGVSERAFELAVRPDAFRSLHGRDQTSAVLELAGVPDLSVDALIAAGCPEAVRDYAKHLDGSLEGYHAATKAAFTDRTEASRALAAAKAVVDSATRGHTAYDGAAHARDEVAHGREAPGLTPAMDRSDVQGLARNEGNDEYPNPNNPRA